MLVDILKTKLFAPPARPNQVARPALLAKLEAARREGVPCFLISAPAGFGKTMLVSAWTRASQRPSAWLALDEDDNDPARFWRYVVSALQTTAPDLGRDLLPALAASPPPPLPALITALVNELAGAAETLSLILEDYHVIEAAEVHASLNFLLDHLPPQLHLVITTRSDPPLNLARRRGRGQLLEIRGQDLRFTAEEAAALLNQLLQLGLAGPDLAALTERTEGWAAGLQMAALSMQDEPDRHAFIAALAGDDRYIADYLLEEVLQRQPAEFQRFLLQTSILDRLSARLCDAVTGRTDSRAMLNALERANLFLLPLDNRREWFRYHQLFAELLRRRLRDTQAAETLADLHRAASAWLEAQGDLPGALRHARHATDIERVRRLLEQNIQQLFTHGELPQLFEAARALPPEARAQSLVLCMGAAWAGLATNHHAEIPDWLAAVEAQVGRPAEAALTDPALDADRRAILLEALTIGLHLPTARPPAEQRAHILAIQDQLNRLPDEQVCALNPVANLRPVLAFDLGLHAEAQGELALAAAAQADAMALARQTRNGNLFHLAGSHLARTQWAQGQLRDALQTYSHALAEAPSLGEAVSPYIALCHAGLGALHYEWNNLALAERYFETGLTHARLWQQWEALEQLALGRARLRWRLGEAAAALAILEDLEAPPMPGMDFAIRARAAWTRARVGEQGAAAAWLAAQGAPAALELNPVTDLSLLDVARLLAEFQRPAEAVALLEKIVQFAEAGARTNTLIQAQAALAGQLARLGENAAALPHLVAALRLAEPGDYIATFLEEGASLLALLGQAARADPRLGAYVDRLRTASEAPARPPSPLAEPLSERELEVLGHIAAGLSNPEIAGRLYLSPNTLKAHTQNIFSKLGVHNRMQAVSRARELGLIA